MKIPRIVVVNNDLYSIRFARNLGENTVGICDGEDHMIWIKTGLTPAERWATFLHELLHAIEFSYGISIPHDVINRIDTRLAAVLFDNWLSAS